MSFSDKVVPSIDRQLSNTGRLVPLNPHAEEFVPFSLKSPSGRTSISEGGTSFGVSGTSGKLVTSRSESSISRHSDEEIHLPDDLTPDFEDIVGDLSQGANNIPFSTLPMLEGNSSLSHGSNGSTFLNKIGFSGSSYGETASSSNLLNPSAKPWEKQISNKSQFMSLVNDKAFYNGNPTKNLLNEQALTGNTEMNPLEFLASRFPGFSSESLKEVYFASGGDLNVTIEMLAKLQLQVDGRLNHNLNSKALSAPNVTARDYSALSIRDGLNGLPNNASPYLPSNNMFNSNATLPTRGAVDFGTALRETPPQESGSIWKYEKRGTADVGVGSSRSPQVLASSYNGGPGRGIYSGVVANRSTSRAAPWLDTGDAVANMYTAMREEARENARLRDLCLEKARQAYLTGNTVMAKELSVQGQLHTMQMKAAHEKAEAIYRQRNPVVPERSNNNGRGQERIIDLQNLHLPEALHVLKRELAMLRTAARSANARLHVYIYVGIDNHTRGPRSPARLPVAVQRYLLEEEGLDYTEPQPGMLGVQVY